MRFRFLVATPVLSVFVGISFTAWARKHWHSLVVLFCLSAALCVYELMILIDQGTGYWINGGTASINFALAIVFMGLFPVRFPYTVLIGLIMQTAHAVFLWRVATFSGIQSAAYTFNEASIFAVVCLLSFERDRVLRREFLHQQSVVDEKEQIQTQLLSFVSLDAIERANRSGKPVADAFGEVTVIFCDIVGFTQLSERLAPKHLVEVLNDVFSALDELAVACRVEKVKTIGDAYMAIAGTTDENRNSAEDGADFSLRVHAKARELTERTGHPLTFRIGMHTGALIGGVVGRQKMAYDYWGKTVNIGSRLESTGMPGKVHVSEATYWRLVAKYELESRGNVEMKGIGPMASYFLASDKATSAPTAKPMT
jgi:class 3 adenylate cyclase